MTIQAIQICPNIPSFVLILNGMAIVYIIRRYVPIPIDPIITILSVIEGFVIILSISYYSDLIFQTASTIPRLTLSRFGFNRSNNDFFPCNNSQPSTSTGVVEDVVKSAITDLPSSSTIRANAIPFDADTWSLYFLPMIHKLHRIRNSLPLFCVISYLYELILYRDKKSINEPVTLQNLKKNCLLQTRTILIKQTFVSLF